MAGWEVLWNDQPTSGKSSITSCTLTRRNSPAYDVDIAFSTTDSPDRQLLHRPTGRQRPLADGGTREFSVTLPGADLTDVPDGPIRFGAPKATPATALVVTVIWADEAGGARQEQSFIHGHS